MTITDAASIVYAGLDRKPRHLRMTALVAQAVEGTVAAQRDADTGTKTECPYLPGIFADVWTAGYEHWTRTESKIRTGI